MALSYEEGMATLRSIFPSWDPEVLAQLLEANGGHLENTIDMALTMEPPRAASARTPPPPAPTVAATPAQHRQTLSPREKTCASRVKLPDDFLRLPGGDDDGADASAGAYRDRAMTEQERQDALLAQMLQDEIFREQLFADEEFSAQFHGDRRGSESRRASVNGPREKTATEIANETFNAMSAKFSVMSEAMKKKAHEMYLKFQTRGDAPSKQDPYSHRPLMADDSSDEEDGYDARGSTAGDVRQRHAQESPAPRSSVAFSPRARSSFTSRRRTTGTNKKDD